MTALARRVAKKLPFSRDDAEFEDTLARVEQSIDTVPSIAQLARTPFLLTMITCMAGRGPLPRTRHELYARALEQLLYQWDMRRNVPGARATSTDDIRTILSLEKRLRLMEQLARRLAKSDERLVRNRVPQDILRDVFQKFLERRCKKSPGDAEILVDQAIDLLRDRNYVLADRGDGPEGRVYGFLHRGFLEYLVALDLKRRYVDAGERPEDLSNLIRSKALSEAWHEPFRLLAGMLEETRALKMIKIIAPEKIRFFNDITLLTLALNCYNELDDEAYDLAQVKDGVSTRLFKLICETPDYTAQYDFKKK